MYGYAVEKKTLSIVMEYMERGDLFSILEVSLGNKSENDEMRDWIGGHAEYSSVPSYLIKMEYSHIVIRTNIINKNGLMPNI